jgi:hypothetical protein
MKPSVLQVPLPGKRLDNVIPIRMFDFVSQLHSLLSNPELNCAQNLTVNATDPFLQYVPPDGRLHECLSGLWYSSAWNYMEQNTNCNFMIPIIFYIDKMQISIFGKLSTVQMSLAIFNKEAWCMSCTWRPLGYIANEEFFFSAS